MLYAGRSRRGRSPAAATSCSSETRSSPPSGRCSWSCRSPARLGTCSARSSAGGSAPTAAARCRARGRWFHLLSGASCDRAEAWFDRRGDWAVFLGRLTPVVRSFISIPPGVFRHPLGSYTRLTLMRAPRSGASGSPERAAGVGTGYQRASTTISVTSTTLCSAIVAVSSRCGSAPSTLLPEPHRRDSIPLVDVKAQYAPFPDELKERFAEVLEAGASFSARTCGPSRRRRLRTSACP